MKSCRSGQTELLCPTSHHHFRDLAVFNRFQLQKTGHDDLLEDSVDVFEDAIFAVGRAGGLYMDPACVEEFMSIKDAARVQTGPSATGEAESSRTHQRVSSLLEDYSSARQEEKCVENVLHAESASAADPCDCNGTSCSGTVVAEGSTTDVAVVFIGVVSRTTRRHHIFFTNAVDDTLPEIESDRRKQWRFSPAANSGIHIGVPEMIKAVPTDNIHGRRCNQVRRPEKRLVSTGLRNGHGDGKVT